MADLTDEELELALNGACHTVEVVVWLAREVKRYRAARHDKSREFAPPSCVAVPPKTAPNLVILSGNAPLEIFPFVTPLHREVVLRHRDEESQDIEMTPDEADRVADQLRAAAVAARAAEV
jgi:hypothetical protein